MNHVLETTSVNFGTANGKFITAEANRLANNVHEEP